MQVRSFWCFLPQTPTAVFCLFGGTMKKITMYSELAYIVGLMLTAIGNALMTQADFGLSMVVAPSYLIHLKVSEWLPFYSFGMSGYIFQGALILLTALIMKRFRLSYLFSFVTAFIFGNMLDLALIPAGLIPTDNIAVRIAIMTAGLIIVTAGVSMLFNTYISPEAYELLVKEVSRKTGIDTGKMKIIYDMSSLVLSLALSVLFFGFNNLAGLGIGTIVSAVFNGVLIAAYLKIYKKYFVFKDLFKARHYFE